MKMKKYWLVLWSLWAARLVKQPTTVVRVQGGLVRGVIAADGSHRSYLAIPYASYQQRFQASHPNHTWQGILDATDEHIRCTQRFTKTWITGQEDCLALNVYTPLEPIDQLKPVMAYIHGGGFRDGSGSPYLYGPEYLVRHGVVLVTFNYRLEILGFLCLGIKEAPGNIGLKDQVQALRWIKRNIMKFGGDPNNITLFGESAGSASVLYHMVSPMSKGLFNRAIMQSGSAISPWSLQFDPLNTAILLAKQLGYSFEDPFKLYELFSSKTAKEILSARVPRRDGDVVLSENIFVPCIEKWLPEEELFLPDTPYNMISNGNYNKVSVIIGYNNAEGYMFVGKENDTTINKFDFHGSMPRDLNFTTDTEKNQTAHKIEETYNKKSDLLKNLNQTIIKLSKFEGDSGIVYPVTATIELLTKTMDNPVFAYKLCYDGWMNLLKFMVRFWRYPGATHADDLFYLFKVKTTLPQSFVEMKMINKMTTMWTNFAKYGDPTPEETEGIKWRPVDTKDPKLLVIDKDLSTESLWQDETLLFWNKTYSKYRKKK